ncbi:MAG: SRPBCC family protein [Clostridia bacterium]|nr:SRPBCC family protein [Clostridia bacterium]
MVTLTESVDIPVPFERLQAWADNFQEEFVRWSPFHTECEMYDGGYEKGMRVRFREIVGGLDYNVTGTIAESEKDSDHFRIVFQSDKKTSFITFEGRRTESGCRFIHTEAFGLSVPIIGPILEFLTFKVFYRKWCNWKLIRDDMVLDNRYLKEILTEGKYPERMPEIDAMA